MFRNNEHNNDNFWDAKKTPIYRKAEEILKLAERIAAIVSKDDIEELNRIEGAILENYADWMIENAMIIPAKILTAKSADLYDVKMENAVIIRKAAREIQILCAGLEIYGSPDAEYLGLLQDEIEAFRVLFAEWVKTFDPWDYMIDRWGLFNPPGVNYDDIDPDSDIPYHPDDFLDEDEE